MQSRDEKTDAAVHTKQQDRELIERFRRGDASAWSELTTRFLPSLRRMSRREQAPDGECTCCEDLLADLIQQWLDPSRPLPSNLAAYVHQAARWCHGQQRRRRARERRWLQEADREERRDETSILAISAYTRRLVAGPSVDEDTVDIADDMRVLYSRVARCIDASLTLPERELLAKRAEGMPAADMAQWLGIERPALTKRLQRLIARLREALQAEIAAWSPEDRMRWHLHWRPAIPTPARTCSLDGSFRLGKL